MASLVPDRILEVGLGFWASKTLLSAVELGVFTELATQPGTCEELQRRLGIHARAAADFLDALVALGFLQRENGVYCNSPESDLFLDKAKQEYVGGVLEMSNRRLYRHWGYLTEALRTGENQNEARHGGDDPFVALYADPAGLKEFLRAMSGISRAANVAIARDPLWRNYQSFVDVGAAQGDLAVQVAKANSHLTGAGFDLPKVKEVFSEYVAEHKLADRVKFIGGDFFADALPGADALLMGHILHDWGLPQKQMLVRKAYDALPIGGALIVYDSMIDNDRRQNAFGLLMSLNMLIETPAGFDYTCADCEGWMRTAGFRETRVEHLHGPDWMVIGLK